MRALALTDCALADVDQHGHLRYVPDGVVYVDGGRIVFAGPRAEAPRPPGTYRAIVLDGRLVTPSLVDCHTHLIYAGNRLGDFLAQRDGHDERFQFGGILETVEATTRASADVLEALARRRLDEMADHGVGAVEVKSGYGLSLDGERRILEIARGLSGYRGVEVVTTFLGAHALPREYAGRPGAYIKLLTDTVMPVLASEGLIDMVDCFIDPQGFSSEVIAPYLARAKELGLPVRAHVDQFGPAQGAELAIDYGARSIDHLEYLSATALARAQGAGTIAVLLPFAYLHKSLPAMPPVEGLRTHRISMAVATDLNPGTSPTASLLLAAYLSITLYGLGPAEAFGGITRRAAESLGLVDRGSLDVGNRADLAIWEVDHPYELVSTVFDRHSDRLSQMVERVDGAQASLT